MTKKRGSAVALAHYHCWLKSILRSSWQYKINFHAYVSQLLPDRLYTRIISSVPYLCPGRGWRRGSCVPNVEQVPWPYTLSPGDLSNLRSQSRAPSRNRHHRPSCRAGRRIRPPARCTAATFPTVSQTRSSHAPLTASQLAKGHSVDG